MYQNALIIVLLFVAIWLLRNLFPAKPKPKLGHTQWRGDTTAGRQSPFQAVSIHGYAHNCVAVEAVRGKRYLSAETPLLPLEGCGSGDCHCIYLHHMDRRSGNRGRRFAPAYDEDDTAMPGQYNRRLSTGRRASDLEHDVLALA